MAPLKRPHKIYQIQCHLESRNIIHMISYAEKYNGDLNTTCFQKFNEHKRSKNKRKSTNL